ncbi:MAG: Smr/MutS family protein [Tannerella sp.]|nr:Smr/MutS family protein [Tannerella sp.]
MIYPEDFERKIGFDKIRRLISDKCISSLGKECVDEISFSSNIDFIVKELLQTEEFVRILQDEDTFPTDCFIDMRYSLKRIRPEGTFLDKKELFDIKRSLQTVHNITCFFHKPDRNDETKYPALSALSGDIQVFPKLVSAIDGILDKYGGMKDNASPELMRIRRELTNTMGNISRNLQAILRSAQSEGIVDKDVAPTMRDGRLMIPLAPAFKRKIRGIVHDESATGKTIFIEPESVVEANNRIRELESEEKRETVKILTAFTDLIRPSVADILPSYVFLAKIDFIRAKALFSSEINGIRPDVENKPAIDWQNAKHPLLLLSLKKQEKSLVPLDISLNDENRILIISGPNAGGKSVCLKTVGLLQYMLQCGLLIPLHEKSRTGIFERIFIDIGDNQSIESDLSTYSSHLTNMKFFMRNCHLKTLILIDEFGSGTEPLIGGALAEAILERFNRNGSFGVITTHYQNLKQYAEARQGVINGAMLYDRHLMQPLFSLSVGRPGSSFAVEIARKTGLPDDVIAQASEKVGNDYISMDKYLQDIIRDKRYWETKRQNIRQQEKKLETLTKRYEKDIEDIQQQRKEIMRKAQTQAEQIMAEANAKIENTIRKIRESQADREQTKSARIEFEKFKETISAASEDEFYINRKTEKNRNKKTLKKLKQKIITPNENTVFEIGNAVKIKGQSTVGTIIDIKGKHAIIGIGMFKSSVKTDNLEKVASNAVEKEIKKATFVSLQTADSIHERKLNFKHEIDVRGMRGDEAVQVITYFIDDALIADVSPVRILHGTGNGILRQLIRDYLSTVSGIKQFHDEHVQLGGAGITVIDL